MEELKIPSPRITVHLAGLVRPEETLCGLPLAGNVTGMYVESLNTENLKSPKFQREIHTPRGPRFFQCAKCLHLHPATLTKPEDTDDQVTVRMIFGIKRSLRQVRRPTKRAAHV